MFRKSFKVPYSAHITSDKIIKRVKKLHITEKEYNEKRKKYFGHMVRSVRIQKSLISSPSSSSLNYSKYAK